MSTFVNLDKGRMVQLATGGGSLGGKPRAFDINSAWFAECCSKAPIEGVYITTLVVIRPPHCVRVVANVKPAFQMVGVFH